MNIKEAVSQIILSVEKDFRPGTVKTPERVEKAYSEMLDGYDTDIDSLFTMFDGEGTDQIIIVKDINFWSMCEHHLLPFECIAHVAYLPLDKVIGASKIPRLLMAYAHRLQIQERITSQTAESLMSHLHPRGVAVIIEGVHLCMKCRGIKNPSSKLITSVMLGEFRDDARLRAELLALLGIKNG